MINYSISVESELSEALLEFEKDADIVVYLADVSIRLYLPRLIDPIRTNQNHFQKVKPLPKAHITNEIRCVDRIIIKLHLFSCKANKKTLFFLTLMNLNLPIKFP